MTGENLKNLFVLIFLIFNSFNAQTLLELNLEKSIELALKNNHDLNKSRIDYQIAEEQVAEAYGTSLFPKIDGSVNYINALKRGEIFFETPFFSGSFPAGTKHTLTAGISLEQPLFTGSMFLAVKIANTFADLSKAAEKYTEEEIIKQVTNIYYTSVLSKELIVFSEIQLKRAKENYENTLSMFNAGIVSEYDKIKANVQYQNMKPLLTQAKNQYQLALNNLKLITGIDTSNEIIVSDSLSYEEILIPDFEEAKNLLLQNNKMLEQAELNIQLNELSSSYEFTSYFPSLSAFGNWQMQAQENDKELSRWRFINSINVGLTLKVPIFSGFSRAAKVEQAELSVKKAEEDLSLIRKSLINNLENFILETEKIKEEIEAYKAAVDESERGYEIAKKMYNSGLGTQIELTDALVNVSNSNINLLQSISNYYTKVAEIEQLTATSLND